MLPVIGKCYSKLLNNRLQWIVRYDKISEFQCCFKAGYSTTDNVFELRTLVDREMSMKRGKLFCCFVDLNKAFDLISRQALWCKLIILTWLECTNVRANTSAI